MMDSVISLLKEEYINDFNAWQIYQSLRLHFQKSSYNVEKYGFYNETYSWNKYLKASQYEVHLFDRLAKHYQTNVNYITAIAANFFYLQPKGTWEIPPVIELQDAYIKLKQYIMSPQYYIKQDLTILQENYNIGVLQIVNGEVPEIYSLAHNGIISYESLVLIDFSTGNSKYVCSQLKDSLIWNAYKSKYVKYKPFVCTSITPELKDYIKTQLQQLTV